MNPQDPQKIILNSTCTVSLRDRWELVLQSCYYRNVVQKYICLQCTHCNIVVWLSVVLFSSLKLHQFAEASASRCDGHHSRSEPADYSLAEEPAPGSGDGQQTFCAGRPS